MRPPRPSTRPPRSDPVASGPAQGGHGPFLPNCATPVGAPLSAVARRFQCSWRYTVSRCGRAIEVGRDTDDTLPRGEVWSGFGRIGRVSTAQPTVEPYDALMIVSFGGPEGQDDVIPFLENVTRGRGIPRERLEEVGEHYGAVGGVSAINDQNRAMRSEEP